MGPYRSTHFIPKKIVVSTFFSSTSLIANNRRCLGSIGLDTGSVHLSMNILRVRIIGNVLLGFSRGQEKGIGTTRGHHEGTTDYYVEIHSLHKPQ